MIEMSDLSDFVIDENGVLTEYYGYDSKIVIPDGVRAIDMYVFNELDVLEEITLPSSIERIDEQNFEDCDSLRYNESGGGYYLGNESEPYLVLVRVDIGAKRLEIEDGCKIIFGNAAANNENLTELSIPASVRSIGFMAFYGCTALTELSLPEGVMHIDACAFFDTGIKRLVLPESIEYIDFDAFSTVSLKEVTLPSSVKHIGHGAFTENKLRFNECDGGYYLGSKTCPYILFMRPCDRGAQSILLHKDTRLIYSSAFKRCGRLRSVTLPDGLTEIGVDAFRECTSLESVRIPESVTLIGENAFAGCTSITELSLPKGRLELEAGAFMGCTSVKQVTLGAATVGDNAFDGCESLITFKTGEGSNLYGDCIFADCPSLSEIVLPESLRGRFSEDELDDGASAIIKFV